MPLARRTDVTVMIGVVSHDSVILLLWCRAFPRVVVALVSLFIFCIPPSEI
jgi:hypothetical protein